MTQTSGRSARSVSHDRLELGLGEDLDVLAAAEPLGAELHLRDRLLAGHEQRAPLARDRGERAQQQRRLAYAGLAAEQDERRRHETAAEHAVELGHAGADPGGFLDLDVDEAQQRLWRHGGSGDLPDDLLDKRSEGRAAGAFPEPAPGGIAAFRAAVLDCRLSLRHLPSLGLRPDADRAGSLAASCRVRENRKEFVVSPADR